MNYNTLAKSTRLLSGGKSTEKEDLYLLTDKAQSCLYGGAWGLLWGPQESGNPSQHQETQQVAWKTLTKSQNTLKGSLLKTSLGSPPLTRCDPMSARPGWFQQEACWL